ncbi:DUF4097 and DUF4098 domain-containing protein YvlB [Enterococcus sp. PF1-24]|uniref:daptomycin-sensing surface protein LiaX n=1 Tax=unclassified Enterococcus TaxID=2608891 RepID=UPI002476AB04|nr:MULTISPECIES: daptomycin-sensing surface protein LiaX [unclassified Enterococcus]MDH6363350.1 DUF4097 and DUF4098 domain-containing protein YvlB [Enterococcus sp. PFB1-1]MDH6400349.1 DUF4097 and DUF4098 domain-containing protein YvlB [Enterococcus sp. PF1-24]
MKERDRVLELVKKGILSTEEALDLLESMATEKDSKQIEKVADELHNPQTDESSVADIVNEEFSDETEAFEDEEAASEEVKDNEAMDRENLEQILEELATEANRASAEIDEVNLEIKGIELEIKSKQEKLMELNTKEELDALDIDDLQLRTDVENAMNNLEEELAKLNEEKATLDESLKNIRKDQWNGKKDNFNEKIKNVKIEIPDDLKEQANEALTQVGKFGSELGRMFKKTFRNVSESVQDNVEWKDINMKVPGIATTKFEHVFEYEATEATLIDVKVANGDITFKTWDEPTVKVESKIRLYGKMDAETPLDALMERSKITVDEDQISFQIPNKRVRADLVFYLPKRTYDHVAVKLLNGNILVNELDVKDIYMKSTNGNITVEQLNGTMLEIEGVNGNIAVKNGEILDLIIETVNGTVTITAAVDNISTSIINGDIRMTLAHESIRKISANSVNGNVKVALPNTIAFDGLAKTSLGSINSRMTDYETIREKKEKMNQLLQFRRTNENEVAKIDLGTATGNIFLKDVANKGE